MEHRSDDGYFAHIHQMFFGSIAFEIFLYKSSVKIVEMLLAFPASDATNCSRDAQTTTLSTRGK